MNHYYLSGFVLLVSIALAQSALEKRGFKVYNGDKVLDWEKNPYKFVVLLTAFEGVCTGSLINKDVVLTAGHCFTDPTVPLVFAELEHAKFTGSADKFINIKGFTISPRYQRTFRQNPVSGWDYAVAHLEKPVIGKGFQVTTINFARTLPITYGQTITIIGYGKDSYRNELSGDLKIGKSQYIQCPRVPEPGRPICLLPTRQLKGQMSESGDSGGPAVVNQNGKIIALGVCTGFVSWKDGLRVSMYAAASENYDFIAKFAMN